MKEWIVEFKLITFRTEKGWLQPERIESWKKFPTPDMDLELAVGYCRVKGTTNYHYDNLRCRNVKTGEIIPGALFA